MELRAEAHLTLETEARLLQLRERALSPGVFEQRPNGLPRAQRRLGDTSPPGQRIHGEARGAGPAAGLVAARPCRRRHRGASGGRQPDGDRSTQHGDRDSHALNQARMLNCHAPPPPVGSFPDGVVRAPISTSDPGRRAT